MPGEEEKKKRTKKLVVEETSEPEVVTEAVLEPETQKTEEQEVVDEDDKIKTEDVKEESPQESILIPKEDKIKEEIPKKPSNSEDKDSKVSIFWVILLALFIIASLVAGGILIFRAGVEKGKLGTGGTAEISSSPTASPTASPSAQVKREDLKVQVLNGTGKVGFAATAKDYLEGLGYKNIETGNASTSDFTETVISIKDTKKDYLETLKTDLSVKYKVAKDAKTLSSGGDFDAAITIGTSTK